MYGKYHKEHHKLKKFIPLAVAAAMAFSFALPASAAGRIDFIDVSHYQASHGLPLSVYQTAKRGHIDGVVVKVSDGNSVRDAAAAVNIANARAAGLRVSAYHYARPTSKSDARAEARWFDKNLQADGFSKTKDGYVVIDIEQQNLTHSKSALTSYVNAFIAEMHRLGYVKTDIYSGRSYYGSRLIPSQLDNNQPWLARYAYDGNSVLDPGYNRGAHQWSSSQRPFSGVGYVDVNIDYAGKYTGAVSSKVGKVGGVSLVNYLSSKRINNSFSNRAKLAVEYGIVTKVGDYYGTAAQNIALLSNIKSGKKVSKKAQSAVKKTSTRAATKTSVLKIGSRGSSVKTMQSKLASVYFYPDRRAKNHGVDGLYGPKTANAVKRFQLTHGLIADGIYGPRTAAALSKAISKKSSSSKTYTVKSGDTLWGISRAKGTTVSKLKSKNGLHSDLIYPGQKLKY